MIIRVYLSIISCLHYSCLFPLTKYGTETNEGNFKTNWVSQSSLGVNGEDSALLKLIVFSSVDVLSTGAKNIPLWLLLDVNTKYAEILKLEGTPKYYRKTYFQYHY